MKKISASLLCLALLCSLCACGGSPEVVSDGGGSGQVLTSAPDTLSGSTATGRVYYLNPDAALDEVWQALAAEYSAALGIEVKVVTQELDAAALGGGDAPTLFSVNGQSALAAVRDYCADLSDTPVYGELSSPSFAMTEDGQVLALAGSVDSYGLLVNRTLLEQAGHSVEELSSFTALRYAVEDISNRRAELGFAAFVTPVADDTLTRRLVNVPLAYELRSGWGEPEINRFTGQSEGNGLKGSYLAELEDFWRLWAKNCCDAPSADTAATAEDARQQFLAGEAVFMLGGSEDYEGIHAVYADEELDVLPLYMGLPDEERQGLCSGSESYWCVNAAASAEDIQATEDFLYWCVSSEHAVAALSEAGLALPYRAAPVSANLFLRRSAELAAAGKESVEWVFTEMPSEEWVSAISQGLTAFAAERINTNWKLVENGFCGK